MLANQHSSAFVADEKELEGFGALSMAILIRSH